jgi:hypothetical protein
MVVQIELIVLDAGTYLLIIFFWESLSDITLVLEAESTS